MKTETNGSGGDYIFGRGQAFFILVIVSILNMINQMDRAVFSVAQEPIKIALGLSDTEVGLFQTVFWLGLALMTLPIAYLCDRWSRKKMMGILAISWSFFTFLTGLGRNFVTIFLPRLFVGIGESGFTSGGQALLVRAWPERLRGTILSIFQFLSNLGQPLGMALGGMLIVQFNSWSTPFFAFAIPGILFGIVAFFVRDYPTVPPPVRADAAAREGFFTSVITLFRIPTLLRVYLGYAAICIVLQSILIWAPTFMMRAQGIKADQAGLLTGIVGVLGLVGGMLGGILSDRWQKRNPRARMIVCSLSALIGTLLIIPAIALDMQGIGYVIICLWSVVAMTAMPANAAVTQDCAPLDKRSQAWGVNNLLAFFLGPGWMPLVVGAISDRMGAGAYGLKVALLVACAFGFIAAIMYFLGIKYYEADVARAREADIQNRADG